MNIHKLKTFMQLAPDLRNRALPSTRSPPCVPSRSPPKVDQYPHFWRLRLVLPFCECHTNGTKKIRIFLHVWPHSWAFCLWEASRQLPVITFVHLIVSRISLCERATSVGSLTDEHMNHFCSLWPRVLWTLLCVCLDGMCLPFCGYTPREVLGQEAHGRLVAIGPSSFLVWLYHLYSHRQCVRILASLHPARAWYCRYFFTFGSL